MIIKYKEMVSLQNCYYVFIANSSNHLIHAYSSNNLFYCNICEKEINSSVFSFKNEEIVNSRVHLMKHYLYDNKI